ncbi:MAG: hypothetical protein ABI293_01330 [Rhodanobacter sp.]
MRYRFLLRSVRDPHQTDALFQEKLEPDTGARAGSQPQTKFSTWPLQIAHNLTMVGRHRQPALADSDETAVILAQLAGPEHEQADPALSGFKRPRNLQRAT